MPTVCTTIETAHSTTFKTALRFPYIAAIAAAEWSTQFSTNKTTFVAAVVTTNQTTFVAAN